MYWGGFRYLLAVEIGVGQEVRRLPGLQVPDQFGYQFGASEHRPLHPGPELCHTLPPAAAGRGETPRFGNQPGEPAKVIQGAAE